MQIDTQITRFHYVMILSLSPPPPIAFYLIKTLQGADTLLWAKQQLYCGDEPQKKLNISVTAANLGRTMEKILLVLQRKQPSGFYSNFLSDQRNTLQWGF